MARTRDIKGRSHIILATEGGGSQPFFFLTRRGRGVCKFLIFCDKGVRSRARSSQPFSPRARSWARVSQPVQP